MAAARRRWPCHLEHVEERLARLEDLHVRRLRLMDRFVVLVARLNFARKCLVDLRQAIRQDGQVLLDLGLLLRIRSARACERGVANCVSLGRQQLTSRAPDLVVRAIWRRGVEASESKGAILPDEQATAPSQLPLRVRGRTSSSLRIALLTSSRFSRRSSMHFTSSLL